MLGSVRTLRRNMVVKIMAKDNTAKKTNTDSSDEPLRALAGGRSKSASPSRMDMLYERTRLAIVSALAVNPVLSFAELKQMLNLSDGNLSVHAQKLESAGLVKCRKYFQGKSPRTEYRLTEHGRKALERYLGHMEAVIKTVREKDG